MWMNNYGGNGKPEVVSIPSEGTESSTIRGARCYLTFKNRPNSTNSSVLPMVTLFNVIVVISSRKL